MNQRLPLWCSALWLSVSAGMACAAVGADTYISYSGTATAPRTDQFLYREHHVLHYRDGKITDRVVLYTCRDGSAFARKTVSYANPLAPNFRLEDASNGMLEGVRSAGDAREIFFRGNRDDPEKTGGLPQVPGLVADSGFDEFVRANWQPLLDGKTLNMRFLVPSRMETMNFAVQHVRSEQLNRAPVEVFRLKLSGVLGLIMPGIDVYYGANDHVLMRYVGLSDLRDRSNSNIKAEIDFPPGERKPVDPNSLANAEKAPLAPCT